MPTMTVSLPQPLKHWIDCKVESGAYGSASEYVRELIRLAQREEAKNRLEQLLLDGLNAGDPVEASPEFWEDLRAQVRKRAASPGKRRTKKK